MKEEYAAEAYKQMSRTKSLAGVIRTTKKATGWGVTRSAAHVCYGRIIGIDVGDYAKYKCYKRDRKRLNKFASGQRDYLKRIRKAEGCSSKQAREILIEADKLNITRNRYVNFELWKATPEELQEFKELIDAYNIKQKKFDLWKINVINEKTGCGLEEAAARLEASKKKRISFFVFISKGIYAKSAEEILNGEDENLTFSFYYGLLTIRYDQPEIKERCDRILEEKGWSLTRLRLDCLRSSIFAGASFNDYCSLKLYNLDIDEQKKYLTAELWHMLYLRYCDYADNWKYFKNKGLFNDTFSDFIFRKWLETSDMTREEFNMLVENEDEIIYKPNDLACGIGIEVINTKKDAVNIDKVYREIKSRPDGIIESIIQQHDYMNSINPNCVNTIRVQVMRENNEVKILNASLRTGTSTKQRTDNFRASGLAASIDKECGKVITDGVNSEGERYELHPVTGIRFRDIEIPYWDAIIDAATQASLRVDNMPYMGWDVCICKDGTIQFIEGNHDAGIAVHQYPMAVCHGEGIRYTVDKYLWFDDDSKIL